jgi:hypothetical protein
MSLRRSQALGMGFGDYDMAPAFPACSNALYERDKGELVADGYYIFYTRRPATPTQFVVTCTPRRPAVSP